MMALPYAVVLLAVFGRGLWQVVVPKSAAFVIQAVLFAGVVTAVLIRDTKPLSLRLRGTRRSSVVMVTFLLLWVVAALSAFVTTSVYRENVDPLPYMAVGLFASGWWLLTSTVRLSPSVRRYPLSAAIVIAAGVALGVTALEVLRIWRPPGSVDFGVLGLIRPAGITGAMQHHAILMAAAFFVLWEIGRNRRSTFTKVVAVLCAAASITSLTRSGAMIVGLGVFLANLPEGFPRRPAVSSRSLRRVASNTAILVVSILAAWGLWDGVINRGNAVPISEHLMRVASSVDLSSPGNFQRVGSWSRGVRQIAQGPVLIGYRTGMVTNVTRRLGSGKSYVVESGVLQQILNYGVVGCFLFYLMMILVGYSIDSRYIWLRAACWSLILNSAVYQTIEVFPVIVILGALPWVADWLSADSGAAALQT